MSTKGMVRDILVGAVGVVADLIATKRRRTKEWLTGTGPAPHAEGRHVYKPRHPADEAADA